MKTVIIGGGAAGMFAACTAASLGHKVLLIEQNARFGKKLAITGKGRCNVTNNCDSAALMRNIPTNGRFLYGAFARFSPQDTMEWFERAGVPLKTERGNRVFPQSDKAADIVAALEREMKRLGVETAQDKVTAIAAEGGAVVCVKGKSGSYLCDRVILATGGMSYSATGSDGSGYKLAKRLGHTIVPQKPSLVPLETAENCAVMMGLSLRNVTLTVMDGEKAVFKEQGELLFTHFGVSGPLVLSASSRMKQGGNYRLLIDFKPALDEKTLDARIQRDFKDNINKKLENSLGGLLPEKAILPMINAAEIDPERRVNELTREERRRLLTCLKAFPLTFTKFRPIEEAIITDGGIDVREINPKTMESKLVRGLFFAGEIIDAAGYTGGFNLQIAFSTAYTAAISLADTD